MLRPAYILAIICLTSALWAQTTPAQPAPQDFTYTVSTTQRWTDTHIDLRPGDSLLITANEAPTSGCDPRGVSKVKIANLPVASLPGALIAKIGNGNPIAIGAGLEMKAADSGRLFLGPNTWDTSPCQGSIEVKAHLTPAVNAGEEAKRKLNNALQIWLGGQLGGSQTPANGSPNAAASGNAPANAANSAAGAISSLLKISPTPLDASLGKQLDTLPRRVTDAFNNQGDMVNFVLVGPLKDVQAALAKADWHLADTRDDAAIIRAIQETIANRDYRAMPMSQLMLFGRVQDYGYEQAEPYAVVASRHHFRLWKAPFQYKGQDVWVGAGTHDIGFERDQRNGKVTHKIDPAVDGERDNVGESLQKSGLAKSLFYYLPPNPVQDARNATGGSYHSDGRILVVFLQ